MKLSGIKYPLTHSGSLGVLEQSLFYPSLSLPQSDPKPGKTMPGGRGGGRRGTGGGGPAQQPDQTW